MVAFPPCKINLGLNVIRKRDDGFHDIETCFYPVPWSDILEVIPSQSFSFAVTGISIPGENMDNLCVRAFNLIQQRYHIPEVSIHLHKIIPTGAGLGGGSSDAAWTLRLLNDIFELKISKEELRTMAAQLGSDCSFFIDDMPMMGTGRGEVLSPANVSLKGKRIVIVKPEVHISTAQAYAGVVPSLPRKPLSEMIEVTSIEEWRASIKNDFEPSILDKFSVIDVVKQRLYHAGALYASMSGSGSAVFGIFNSKIDTSSFDEHLVWSGIL